MSEWVTYAQAAEILGCHISNVPKLVSKGQLTSRGRRGASFDRDRVEQLALARASTRRPRKLDRAPRPDRRPDPDHEWLTASEAARRLGVTRPAVSKRVRRGRIPAVEHNGRLWIRADHLELVERARLAARTRRV